MGATFSVFDMSYNMCCGKSQLRKTLERIETMEENMVDLRVQLKAIQSTLAIFTKDLEKRNGEGRNSEASLEPESREFEFDTNIFLLNPRKVDRYEADNKIDSGIMEKLEKDIERCGSELAYMQSSGLSEEELEKFLEANRWYTIRLWHDDLLYQRMFKNKEDWHNFEKRLNAWLLG